MNLERKAGLVTNIVVIQQQTSVWDSKPQNLSCFPTTQDGGMLNHLEFFLFPHCLPASKIPAAWLTLFWNYHYQLIIVPSLLGFCGDKMRKTKAQYTKVNPWVLQSSFSLIKMEYVILAINSILFLQISSLQIERSYYKAQSGPSGTQSGVIIPTLSSDRAAQSARSTQW